MKILKAKNNFAKKIHRNIQVLIENYIISEKNLKEAIAISYKMQLFQYKSTNIRRNIYSVSDFPINAIIL
jgi:hypothetical protein